MIVDAIIRDPLSENEAKDLLLKLCDIAGMNPVAGPFSYRGEADPPGPGVSAVLIIETSNIIIHTYDFPKHTAVNIDLFSCKEFPLGSVLDFLREKGFAIVGDPKLLKRTIKR